MLGSMKTLLLLVSLALVGCGSPGSPVDRSGGAAGDSSGDTPSNQGGASGVDDAPVDSLGGMGGEYWGPWICKEIPGGRQCARYPADSGVYD